MKMRIVFFFLISMEMFDKLYAIRKNEGTNL